MAPSKVAIRVSNDSDSSVICSGACGAQGRWGGVGRWAVCERGSSVEPVGGGETHHGRHMSHRQTQGGTRNAASRQCCQQARLPAGKAASRQGCQQARLPAGKAASRQGCQQARLPTGKAASRQGCQQAMLRTARVPGYAMPCGGHHQAARSHCGIDARARWGRTGPRCVGRASMTSGNTSGTPNSGLAQPVMPGQPPRMKKCIAEPWQKKQKHLKKNPAQCAERDLLDGAKTSETPFFAFRFYGFSFSVMSSLFAPPERACWPAVQCGTALEQTGHHFQAPHPVGVLPDLDVRPVGGP